MGPGFASPGVAVKQVARNAIAEAVAFIESVFMLVSNDKAVPPLNMNNFSCGCDYKKIHPGSVSWSNDDGATIIEVLCNAAAWLPSSGASLTGVIGGSKMKSYLMETDIGRLTFGWSVMPDGSRTNSLVSGSGLRPISVE
jgi:hypothetical protein